MKDLICFGVVPNIVCSVSIFGSGNEAADFGGLFFSIYLLLSGGDSVGDVRFPA